jgi:hypothetical protein
VDLVQLRGTAGQQLRRFLERPLEAGDFVVAADLVKDRTSGRHVARFAFQAPHPAGDPTGKDQGREDSAKESETAACKDRGARELLGAAGSGGAGGEQPLGVGDHAVELGAQHVHSGFIGLQLEKRQPLIAARDLIPGALHPFQQPADAHLNGAKPRELLGIVRQQPAQVLADGRQFPQGGFVGFALRRPRRPGSAAGTGRRPPLQAGRAATGMVTTSTPLAARESRAPGIYPMVGRRRCPRP